MGENTINNLLYLIGELPVPIIIMAFAWSMWKTPPKLGENGYNTKRSRQSEEAWTFAQTAYGRCATKIFAAVSALTLTVGLIAIFLNFGEIVGFATFLAVTSAQVAALIVTIIITEHRLKENFDEDGKPK